MTVFSVLFAAGASVGWGVSLVMFTAIVVIASFSISRNVQFVRLVAAVAVAVVAGWFVVRYDSFARERFEFDHPGERVTEARITKLVAVHAAYAYAVPIAGCVMGVLVLSLRPYSPVLLRLIVLSLWVSAFAWVAYIIFIWRIQNVPVFSGMKWHLLFAE